MDHIFSEVNLPPKTFISIRLRDYLLKIATSASQHSDGRLQQAPTARNFAFFGRCESHDLAAESSTTPCWPSTIQYIARCRPLGSRRALLSSLGSVGVIALRNLI